MKPRTKVPLALKLLGSVDWWLAFVIVGMVMTVICFYYFPIQTKIVGAVIVAAGVPLGLLFDRLGRK